MAIFLDGRADAMILWKETYRETELYKAAIRLYTKPLFSWRKALSTSTDGRNLYDFAKKGLKNLDHLHESLSKEKFSFRPGSALHFNFNGKHRTLYIYPWEERLVDLLLYRLLNRRLQNWFSPHSYAYRIGPFGVDVCQTKIGRRLVPGKGPFFILKRDIREYFNSIDHSILLDQISKWVGKDDYLFQLLRERIEFSYVEGEGLQKAVRGIPFGTAIACWFANLHLTEMDHALAAVPGVHYFRYADDLLVAAETREGAKRSEELLDFHLQKLQLQSKESHEKNLFFCEKQQPAIEGFVWADRFKHLGLQFRANGVTGLSRDKFRKICNLFRYAFRRKKSRFNKMKDPLLKAKLAIQLAKETLENGVRNVAIIDYYLKHVKDEKQIGMIDRWLAEAVLALSFGGGHQKGNFRKLPFQQLREMGLPSLAHRRRLILHGELESPFFMWKSYQKQKGFKGTAARPERAFSPIPKAVV